MFQVREIGDISNSRTLERKGTEMLTWNPSRKSPPKKNKPFQILKVRNHKITVDNDLAHRAILLDRIEMAPRTEEAELATKREETGEKNILQIAKHHIFSQQMEKSVSKVQEEYDVQHHVDHDTGINKKWCRVRWCAYNPAEDS